MPKHLTQPSTYKSLVTKISQEFSELEFFVKLRTVEGNWRIGKYIHEHLVIAKEGIYLNQELLNERLAVKYT